jgi:MFS family permease
VFSFVVELGIECGHRHLIVGGSAARRSARGGTGCALVKSDRQWYADRYLTAADLPGGQGLPSEGVWRDAYLTVLARAISACGTVLSATSLVLALQYRGAGGYAVAAVLIAAAAPPTLLAPLTGRVADRLDSRLLLLSVSVVQAGICTVLAFLPGTAAIIALVFVLGCGTALTTPTLAALLPEIVGPDLMPRASAIGQTASSVGMLLAPALGGLLYGAYGLRVPLLVDAGTYLAITAGALLIRTRRGVSAARLREPRVSLFRDALLRPTLIMVGAVVVGASVMNVADVFFIRDALHGSPTVYGVLGAVWTGSMLVGAWLLSGRKLADGRMAVALLVTLAGACAAIGLAATVGSIGWLVPLWIAGGVCNGAVNVSSTVLVARRVPAEVRGRAFAIFGAVANGANAGGYLLGGVLLGVLPARMVIGLSGLGGLAVALTLAVPLLKAAARDRPAPTPQPQPVASMT